MAKTPGYRTDSFIFHIADGTPEVPTHPAWKSAWVHRLVKNAMVPLMAAQGVHYYVHGLEHMPASGPALVASNHFGYYDFIAGALPGLLRGRRPVRYMAKKELFDHWFLGRLCRGAQLISVDRELGAASVDVAVERLKDGEYVGIFPEATISRSFELAEFKTGAARIAQRSGAPLIPCAIWGSQRFWTKGRKKELGRTGYPIVLNVGPAISTDGTPEEVTARLKLAVQELLDAARARYTDLDGPFEEGADWIPASMGGTAPTLEEARELDAQEKAERAARKVARQEKKQRKNRKG